MFEYKHTKQTKRDSLLKRQFNIDSFSALDREGLEYGVKERRVYLHSAPAGERVFIQYPGKEAVASKEENKRPWDFRPKLDYYLNYPQTTERTFLKDLAFGSIWDDLDKFQPKGPDGHSKIQALLYHLTYLTKHEKVNGKYRYEDIDIATGEVVGTGFVELSWYKPYLSPLMLQELNSLAKNKWTTAGIAIEAYVLYMDLLAQNEDCKYYYRDVVVSGKKWNNTSGRDNTTRTHMTVLGLSSRVFPISTTLNKFSKGRGVAPVLQRDIPMLTNNLIIVESKKCS